ncbi:MAG TPA: hypothetical protein VFX03_13580, partial [Thermomicrobiales bacterium]|nr:hypothetical protein [Thermomicrobiales bacterium]
AGALFGASASLRTLATRHKRSLVIAAALVGKCAIVAESSGAGNDPIIGHLAGEDVTVSRLLALEQKVIITILDAVGISEAEVFEIAADIDREDQMIAKMGNES